MPLAQRTMMKIVVEMHTDPYLVIGMSTVFEGVKKVLIQSEIKLCF